jgi:hypothetical protein
MRWLYRCAIENRATEVFERKPPNRRQASPSFDLPLNFHPAAVRASANDVTPFGAVSEPA